MAEALKRTVNPSSTNHESTFLFDAQSISGRNQTMITLSLSDEAEYQIILSNMELTSSTYSYRAKPASEWRNE